MTSIRLENVSKDFGELRAVNNVSFKVEKGEVLTLLGPSGCGKSTTLRMIAGFLYPNEGHIFFGNRDMTYVSPQKRNTAMVFQSYALWPHLNVRKNVEFGLIVRKIQREERNRRVREALKRVRMESLIERMPSQLSGGQQQRVAVARALVVNPDVLLLDEPLSNLDAKLRVETRQEIRDIVKDLGLTTIFVTHDQSEALSISDRIAVLDAGYLRQLGQPEEIWTTPTSAFVGSFIGEANTLEMVVSEVKPDYITLTLPNTEGEAIELRSTYFKGITKANIDVKVVIRPDRMNIHQNPETIENLIPAKIRSVMFFGSYTYVTVQLTGGIEINLHIDPENSVKRHEKVFIEVPPEELRAFGPENF